MTSSTSTARTTRRAAAVCAVMTAVAATLQLLHGQAEYVDRFGPTWFTLVGAGAALLWLRAGARRGLASVACLAATVFLLPAAVAALFHGLRAVGAIPLPVDGASAGTSAWAVATIFLLWRLDNPLRALDGRPLPIPLWVPFLGVAAALAYPALKTFWVFGGTWLAPSGLAAGVDVDYVLPVLFAVLGAAATVAATRWWDRPAPPYAHPLAVVGGLALTGLGIAGSHATLTQAPDEGPLLGLVVYGGWFVWGLATLGVAARLSTGRVVRFARGPAVGP